MMNIASILERSADLFPAKAAIIAGARQLTYRELDAAASRVANGLVKRGIMRGDRVALSCPNSLEFPIVYFGILKTGASVIPVSTLFTPREVTFLLQNSGAKAYFCFEGTDDLPMGKTGLAAFSQSPDCEHFFMITTNRQDNEPLTEISTLAELMHGESPSFDSVPCNESDTAYFLYTSGTTGTPKGAELTHASVISHLLSIALWFKMDSHDVNLAFMPLFHTLAMTGQMNTTIMTGGTLVLMPRFKPDEALRLMQSTGVTIFGGTPTIYSAILNMPDLDKNFDIPEITKTLRVGFSGGAPMPVELMKRFEEKFDIRIVEAYGLSEVVAVACASHFDVPRVSGSAGQPLPGVQMRVADENGKFMERGQAGEIVIRGPGVMKGYWQRPEETANAFFPNGWFRTGDIGKIDENDNVFIVDRLKDMILRGGYNVYPREIEEVMMTHAAIAQVAVVGIPHAEYGEEVKAVITLKTGTSASSAEIIEWSKTLLARYKYPRIVEIRDSLPMTPSGKILKRMLRE